jgi:hypothetical protein
VSSGPGIEREVLYTAYQQFEKAAEQWFIPRANDRLTLATSLLMATAQYVSPAQLSDLNVLGAIIALLFIHGIAPGKLDPVVLQYFIYDCDLASVHSAFLREWHPSIHEMITHWIATGPDGNVEPFIGHFAAYLDISVCLIYLLSYSCVLKLILSSCYIGRNGS